MNRTSVVLLIMFLMLGVYACGRSNDESGVESKAKGEIKSLGKKASGEVKEVEEDYRVLEAEKDYEKALKEEPKAPPEAFEEPMEGDNFGEK
jgi:hypothetical protein